MKTTALEAPDISCNGCAASIRKALEKVPGVAWVRVDVPTKVVTVTHEDSVSRDLLVEKLDRAGFPVAG